MGFIESAAEAQFRLTQDRIERRLDYGMENQRPELDVKQQKEFLDALGQGKTDEPYRQCLQYHGFNWYPLEQIIASDLPVAVTAGKTEGEWRNGKLKLAFTPRDLATGFPMGPESLDRFLRERKVELQVAARKVPKSALRDMRKRK